MAGRLVAPPDLLASMLQSGADEPVSMMVRRQVLLDIGGCDERLRDYGEDFVLAVNLTSRYGALVSPACWYRYRMHPDSYTHRIRGTGELVRRERELMAWLGEWLRAERIADGPVIDAFRRRRAASAHRPLAAWWCRRRGDAGWWWCRVLLSFHDIVRGNSRGRAVLVVDPPVVKRASLGAAFVVQLRWSVAEQVPVQVRVGAPDGPMLTATHGPGGCRTGDWASDRMCFFLQDANHPRRDSAAATLAIARARVMLTTSGWDTDPGMPALDDLAESHATEQTHAPGP